MHLEIVHRRADAKAELRESKARDMTVKLELSPDVRESLLAQAGASGLPLEAYAECVLRDRAHRRLPLRVPRLVGSGFGNYAKGETLGGISIKELIDEGRV